MAEGYTLTKGAVQTFLMEVKQILNDKTCELRIEERNDKPQGYKITKFPYR